MTRPKNLGGLGFCEIEIFNMCLLARQSWRILQAPNSLSAHLLKAIYFLETTILEAELGPTHHKFGGQPLLISDLIDETTTP
jgi:hypothetical protein